MKKKVIGLCTLFLVFLLGLYTDSFAYTLDDLEAYAEDVLSNSYSTDKQKKCALNIINRKSWISNIIGSSYDGFVCYTSSSSTSTALSLHCWSGTTTVSIPGVVTITPNHYVLNFGDYRDTAHLNWYTTSNNGNFNSYQKSDFFGLVVTESTLPDDPYLFLNGYNPIVNFFVPYDNTTIVLPNNQGQAFVISPSNLDTFCTVGYIDNFDFYKPVSLTVFREDFSDVNNVKVYSLNIDDYMVVNGNGNVKISTMALYDTFVYELVFESPNYQGFATYYLYCDRNFVSGGGGGHGFGSGDFSLNNPQIFIQNLLGTGPSGDDPGSGILGGIGSFFRNLFVPRQGFFESYINDLKTYYSTHFGFIYDSFDIIIEILERIQNIDYTNQTMTLGPYTLPLNDDFELIPEITFDFNDYIENETMSIIHNYYYLIIDGFIIFGLFYLLEREFDRIIADKEG